MNSTEKFQQHFFIYTLGNTENAVTILIKVEKTTKKNRESNDSRFFSLNINSNLVRRNPFFVFLKLHKNGQTPVYS